MPSTALSEPVLPGTEVAPSPSPVSVGEVAEDGWKPPSWDEVVREHADRVYRLAYRLTGNQHDAE
ncbi:MAG TPA: RNA polymerase sigma factor SigE, partial [Pseudonocardiaceae bacterium]